MLEEEQVKRAVGYCIKRFKLKTLSSEDLYQQGWLGIMKAREKYDHDKGGKRAFYYSWAKGEILNYLRSRANNILSVRSNLQVCSTGWEDMSYATNETSDFPNPLFTELELDQALKDHNRKIENPVVNFYQLMQELKSIKTRSLVLVDYSVYAWKIYYRIKSLTDSSNQLDQIYRNVWQDTVRDINKLFPKHRIVFGLDLRNSDKEYWRHKILPEYKAGRTEKTPEFYQCYNKGIEVIDALKITRFSLPLLEYDDTAAIFARLQRESNYLERLVLCTVDGDLLQLVSDQHNIEFYTPRPAKSTEKIKSQLRKEAEVLEYAEHCFKKKISYPKEIAVLKALKGEKGDNIPKGNQYLPLIDLYNNHIVEVPFLDSYVNSIKDIIF